MNLKTAVEEVYDAFSDVEKPASVDGCPCCMTADQYEKLTSKPLRELTYVELDEYASDVLLTMGSKDDYKYFLPRILELSIEEGRDWVTSIEITGNKMKMAGFEEWDKQKQAAIENLWLAVTLEIAASESDPELIGFVSSDIDSWLGAATLIPISVSRLLEALEGFPDVVQTLYNYNFKTLFQGRLDNAFLDEPSKGQSEITNWLRHQVETSMK